VFGGAREARRMTERGAAAIKAAGFGALSIHDARHTYASLMIAAGVNAKALSEFSGARDDRDHVRPLRAHAAGRA
jgi:integrase